MKKSITKLLCLLLTVIIVITSCEGPQGDIGPQGEKGDKGDKGDQGLAGEDASQVVLTSHSTTSTFVKPLAGFESLELYSLIGSDDYFPESPTFVYGGQPDGAGLMRNPTGEGFFLITNHEFNRSVSKVYLDKTFKPYKGEYLVNFNGGKTRLCSATLATPEEHGFGPVFLTAGESGVESLVHAIDPLAPADPSNSSRTKPALGHASMENAVPLPKDAYPGKTVIIIGEDDSNGQLIAYVSNTTGDLDNGKLYVLKRTNNDPIETNIQVGSTYDVEFVEIPNAKNLSGAEIAAKTVEVNAIQFARVEDVDYRKGSAAHAREVYFTATGVANGPDVGKTKFGRVYKIVLNEGNPLLGKLEVAAEGDSQAGRGIVNPDNVCVTDNYVYIQEDGDSFYPEATHDSYVWQFNINTKALRPMLSADHQRGNTDFNAKYNTVNVATKGSWEFGAMLDISNIINIPNTFLLNIHPHTWREERFENADGSGVTVADDVSSSYWEGGQTIIIRGLPK